LKILAGDELTLVEMGVVEMKDSYFNAIERRMQ
jgi:phosphoribosylformylglycinamidine synthase